MIQLLYTKRFGSDLVIENIRKFKIKDWKNVKSIYINSFPKEERFPFLLLYFNTLRNNSNLYVMEINNQIIGFIDAINYKNMIFILYLAVDKKMRNLGYGSKLLKQFLNENTNKNIYLNIDEVDTKFSDYKLRKQRLNFYLNNNFYLTNYLSVEKDGNFNIMIASNNNFEVDNYIELDKKISKWYFTKKSKIEEKY